MDDPRLQRFRLRMGVAALVFAVGTVIWALVDSYWLIWLVAFSSACSTIVLLGEYRKVKSRGLRSAAGADEHGRP